MNKNGIHGNYVYPFNISFKDLHLNTVTTLSVCHLENRNG